jgi:Carbohydrate family 9 binding domain-like
LLKQLTMRNYILLITLIFYQSFIVKTKAQTDSSLLVKRCIDFNMTGKGNNPEWQKATWTRLTKIDSGGKENKTQFKIMYSQTGVYVLFEGDDSKITSKFNHDGDDLYDADVFEVFLHPIPTSPLYFEYEINPLGKELVLLITNKNGKFSAWLPWYRVEKHAHKKVFINGGKMKHGSPSKSWSAEIFLPFQLIDPLVAEAPVSGSRWNANFCRLDYDSGKMIKFSWSPIKEAFHEFEKYRSIKFE